MRPKIDWLLSLLPLPPAGEAEQALERFIVAKECGEKESNEQRGIKNPHRQDVRNPHLSLHFENIPALTTNRKKFSEESLSRCAM